MSTENKRMTFVVTEAMEKPLDDMKKELFYNRTQSDMIRTLVERGLESFKIKKEGEKNNES